mmetsp:Transcript_11086/g.14498  ORF Transcript_11086/g.14498 Transcript_11086/m.14498 type:complete len:226 (-) Transcript_11086:64-741(-)
MKFFTKSAILVALVSNVSAFTPVAFRTPSRANSALNVAIDTSDIKNGLTVEIDGEPHKVLEFSIMKQARGAAKMTIKFKNLTRGSTIENTYRSGEKFQTAEVVKSTAQFTYADENGNYYFMDSETFEEVAVGAKIVEDKKQWIAEGSENTLVTFNDQVIEVQVPKTLVATIVSTEPSVKGNTAQGHTKPAVLDCGATVTVPGFISEGETVRVDTEKSEYLDRKTD